MTSIALSKPIKVHNETISVLDIQEPTFYQVEKYGIPFSYSERGDMRLDTRSALAYLPELAGIPRSSAQQLALHDVFVASMTLVGFFTGAQNSAVSDDASTTSPGSGESIPSIYDSVL
ncbi:phage tail protein [Candidatus Williamhamiltonella defendens]|uniref:Phage tail protein n=1 Tax=Candidatus Williamhamiltonella defendens TaxID=138072 RepID=A0A2D3T2R6_9ENTR|nr:phage tail assembly protein [Candidatus Hamiltonella defensa]ATW30087.1 phage tail protein [Candidatus Hamiltonella defensa]ATW32094.1 phage tail protein [Candidatus Hamiltonella defensa]